MVRVSIDSATASQTDAPLAPPTYEGLVNGQEWPTPAVELLADLQDYLDTIRPTKATFQLSEVFDDSAKTNALCQNEDLVRLSGAWPVPSQTGKSIPDRYVNPRAAHAHAYPEIDVQCECGVQVIQTTNDNTVNTIGTADHDHNEGCLSQWRYQAIAKLHDARREIAQDGLLRGRPLALITPRAGLSAPAKWHRGIGVDVEECKRQADDRLANTAAELLQYHPPAKIATAYDCGENIVRNLVNERTDYDVAQLARHRRYGGGDS